MPGFVELFAGAGGMALGLEQAGWKPSCLAEISRDACLTMKESRPYWPVREGDVGEIEWAGTADLVVGGFPCQPFSVAGYRKGSDDDRGGMFAECIRAIEALSPPAFLLENVPNLLVIEGGSVMRAIMHAIHAIGYDARHTVLNAADYGVPQRRRRLFIYGERMPMEWPGFRFPAPTGGMTVREALRDCPESDGYHFNGDTIAYIQTDPDAMYSRAEWDAPSPTVCTRPDRPGSGIVHPGETRPYTVREAARIQGFPDEWAFQGSRASRYRQIGNAVPPPLARALGRAMLARVAVPA